MTTLLEDLQAVLNPLAIGGAHYQVNDAQTAPTVQPYITWLRVVSSANVTLQGNSDLQNTRVQIDIWAQRIADAEAINRALPAAMAAGPWAAAVDLTSQDMFDDAARLHRILREFSVWAKN